MAQVEGSGDGSCHARLGRLVAIESNAADATHQRAENL